MKSVGIVVEYNPFHNGHKYHLKEAEKYGDVVVAVMSGDFVQRGEPSVIDKWKRTETALQEGIDIVAELPVFYSTQSAEIFARGAVGILERLGTETIVFGSESSDMEKLKKIISLEDEKEFKDILQKNLKEGNSYPTAYNKTVEIFLGKDYSVQSNDILGMEYIRALRFWKSSMKPVLLKRKGAGYHSDEAEEDIASASGIRKMIFQDLKNENLKIDEIKKYLPEKSAEIFLNAVSENKITKLSKFYNLIRYSILMQRENLKNIQDMENGFENRLYETALSCEKYDDFFEKITTKRFTIGRVQRILIHVLLGITKEMTDDAKKKIPYVRILGFSQKGREYLKKTEKENKEKQNESKIKIITALKNIKKNLSDSEREFLEVNERAGKIYSMINHYEKRNVPVIYQEINGMEEK